jgi:ATP-dependent helicase HrpA
LVDEQGKTLAVDANLDRLRSQFTTSPSDAPGQLEDAAWNRPLTHAWDFGNLPREITITRGGLRVPAYPAVLDQGNGVLVRLLDTDDRARHESRAGVRRLYYLAQRKSLQAHIAWLPRLRDITLFVGSLPGRLPLEDQLALLLADRAFIGDGDLPRTQAEYDQRLAHAAERAGLAVQDLTALSYPLFEAFHSARLALETLPKNRWPLVAQDVRRQVEALVQEGFLTTTPWAWLQHYPRYFCAIAYRLDKLQHGGQHRDQQAQEQIEPWITAHDQRAAVHRQRGAIDEQLVLLRWMIEELRVSLFAQQLGTSMHVSAQRLEEQWALVAP